MKIECPGCGKTLVNQSEDAGKTGKCPGCGQTLRLPAADAESDADDDSTGVANGKDDPGGEVVFPGEKASAGPGSGPSSVRSKTMILIGIAIAVVLIVGGAFWYLASPARIKLPAISYYNTDSDRYVKRSVSLTPEQIGTWQSAVRKATGDYYTSKEIFFILPNLDFLWNEDGYDEDAAAAYLRRLEELPLPVLRDWRTSLKRATGGVVGKRLSEAAFRILEIERMFTGDTVNTDVSDNLLARMNAVSAEEFSHWAAALDIEIGQAALALILTDPFFEDGLFQKERFDKKLRYEAGKR